MMHPVLVIAGRAPVTRMVIARRFDGFGGAASAIAGMLWGFTEEEKGLSGRVA
jgi:hypothetical protein